jgi:uncharacterized protein (TIGR03067 family)
MRLHAMMAVAAFWLVAADDRDTIQGRWKPVSIERGGKPIASRTEPNDKMALVIEGDKYDWTGGDVPMGGTYTLDPSKTPKEIDLTPSGGPNRGRILKGIYRIQGDTLKVCLAGPGEGRATEFESKEGSRHSFYIMRRAKNGDGVRTPIKESLDRLERALAKRTQTEIPLDLVLGQSLAFLRLREKPIDIQYPNPPIVHVSFVEPDVPLLQPMETGRGRMELTFGDGADRFIVTLNITVRPYQAERGDGRRVSTEESLSRIKKALAQRGDTDVPLNLALGQPLMIPLEELPALFLVSDPQVLDFTIASKKSVLVQPKSVGRTPMAMRFRVGRDQSEWFVITLQVEVQEAGSR